MELRELQRHWHRFGQQDPLWAIITADGKRDNRWDADEFFRLGEEEINSLLAQVARLAPTLGRRRALDFGCGVGRLSQALALHFAEVVGVDIAPSMIKLARRYNRHGRRCRYVLNASSHLRFLETASFDLVYSTLVLQHMEPRFAKLYLEEFLRVVVPHGMVVFQLPGEVLEPPRRKTPPPRPSERQSAARPRILVRRALKGVLPEPWLEAYRRFRDRNKPAVMEMYVTARADVEAFLSQHGARVLDVERNEASGPRFSSFRYFATRLATDRST